MDRKDKYRKNMQEIYRPLMQQIQELIQEKKQVILSIDGRCGSGKSSLAEAIGNTYDCNIMHMDDFYLPMIKRQENWWEIPGGNMDFERIQKEITEPLLMQEKILYRPYNCREDFFQQTSVMLLKQLNILEGSYSQHPHIHIPYSLKIFLTCSAAEQARRLQEREGDHYESFVRRWIPMEELYYRTFGIDQAKDTRMIDTE